MAIELREGESLHENGYVYTGVKATEAEAAAMKAELRLPMARILGRWPEPERLIHKIALAHGLPEIPGYYGCDFSNGNEFIRQPFESGTPADKWPEQSP